MSLKPKRFLGPRPDSHPEVPAAGTSVHVDKNLCAKVCFDWNYKTNYSKEKYVASSLEKYGQRGNVMDEIEKIKDLTHGVRMKSVDSAVDVLSPNRLNPLLQEMEDNRERAYHRKEHQILGRSTGNDAVLPEFTKTDSFRFGKVTQLDESVGKIMYPPKKPEEDPLIKQRYILSHGSYGPGEQKKHYPADWTPAEYRESVEMKRIANDGGKVKEALYWKENRRRLKSTLAHLPPNHTFGVKHPIKDIHVSDLLGNVTKNYTTTYVKIDNDKRPPAGITMKHTDDLDLQRHIVPKLGPLEDSKISKKITEDEIGGSSAAKSRILGQFGQEHVFGVPTIRDPTGRKGMGPKRLADKTVRIY
ncbi:hypothetical protein HK103_002522 [Boothiomyces macroporosus]|uniref:Uncharacterized protein n=1 Tax=Boothiomyces macroporosus TaxID=261099 RepID=A0AAD5UMA7_9FUNG|nr:hypothetical protein HK103_002522 [Boothiomyces macroporosus]